MLFPPAAVRSRSPPSTHEGKTTDDEDWTTPVPPGRPRGWLKPPPSLDPPAPPRLPLEGTDPVARLALVELFAGLRTGRLAAELQGVEVPLSAAAECCPFANSSAERRGSPEDLYHDVRELDEGWASAFVAQAVRLGLTLILLVAGFPCAGTSRSRGRHRPNLSDHKSRLFWQVPRIRDLLRRAAIPAGIWVRIIVENVVMDSHPSWQISQALGCRPTLLKAERKRACARNRLFWCDFEIIPGDSEHLSRGPNANELSLAWAEEEERRGILEEGWEFHPQFSGVLPTFLGWRQWTKQPNDVRGLAAADHQQKIRWAQSGWASAINVWHDHHMLWPIPGGPAAGSDPRILSPEEMERAMGFPVGWTTPSDSFVDEPPDGLPPRPTHILRRNAVGNAIAVPILAGSS